MSQNSAPTSMPPPIAGEAATASPQAPPILARLHECEQRIMALENALNEQMNAIQQRLNTLEAHLGI